MSVLPSLGPRLASAVAALLLAVCAGPSLAGSAPRAPDADDNAQAAIDALVEALGGRGVAVVRQRAADAPRDAEACVQMETLHAARFVVCAYEDVMAARRAAWSQEGLPPRTYHHARLVVRLGPGAGIRLRSAMTASLTDL